MLHILLLILKILGIVLLVILGLLLSLVLLVLFVPVRYRGDASFHGRPEGNVLVSWLFRIFTARLSYDGTLTLRVKVLWFRVFDETLWGREDEEEKEERAADGDILDDETFDELLDRELSAQELSEQEFSGRELSKGEPRNQEPLERELSEKDEEDAGMVHVTELSPEAKEPASEPLPGEQKAQGTEEPGPKPQAAAEQKAPGDKVRETSASAETAKEQSQTAEPKEPEPEFAEKAASCIRKLIEKIRDICTGTGEAYEAARKKYKKIRAIITDAENQKTFRLLVRQTKSLLRHILPGKLKGYVRFGFDDPYYTGKVLTMISPFYGLYARTFTVEPVFDEKVLEGSLHLKGRIRAAALLMIGLRVFANKNFRRLLKRLRK